MRPSGCSRAACATRRACLRGWGGRRPAVTFDDDPSFHPAEAAAPASAPERERSMASAASGLGLGAGPL
eukprot:4380732-Pyramimonas_sp.AAC.1